MSIINPLLFVIEFLSRHKLMTTFFCLAFAAPSLFLAAPDIAAQVNAWSPQAKLTLAGMAVVSVGAAFIALTRWFCQALARSWRGQAEAAQWNAAFVDGTLPGAEKVAIIWRVAGSVTNVMSAGAMLSPCLLSELGKACRKVLVLPDNSPGVGIDTRPQLMIGESGDKIAKFRKSPVRNDADVAIRQAQQWMAHQEPFLASFVAGCEVRLAIHVVASGCSSLTDALVGFGPRLRGSEGTMLFYVHDPRGEGEPDEDLDEDPDDEPGDMLEPVMAKLW